MFPFSIRRPDRPASVSNAASQRRVATAREFPSIGSLAVPPTDARPWPTVEGMDIRTEIREFLTSRRARLTPADLGLPDFGGRRRVAGLRREEVALVAGMSVDYYVRLERGNAAGVSEAVLDGIARALKLNDAELNHLHDLVRAANDGAA